MALGLFAAAGMATADDLALPETQAPAVAPAALPAKGITMNAVRKQFGEPRSKREPVGGDSPKHPPITRWDYDGFVVIFEKDRVIDAVVPGAPPRLHTTAGLSPALDAPPPPEPMAPPMETPEAPAPEAEPVIPEAPADAPADMPPAEPTAEAAPMESPPAEAPPAESPPPDQPPPVEETPAPPPANEPTQAAPPDQYPDDQPPTPK